MAKSYFLPTLLGGALLLGSCDKDPDPTPQPAPAVPSQTVFVVCEGNFNSGNAAVTRFTTSTRTAVRDVYGPANNSAALGDVAQSMTIAGDKGYVVVNNSNRIAVVNLSDFHQVAEITGVQLPRYMAVVGTKGYLTEWVAYGQPGRVSEIDLTTNLRTGRSFGVGELPEQIVAVGNRLVVANSNGNTLSVIDLTNDNVSTVTVPDRPTYLRADGQNRVWALCSGSVVYNPWPSVDSAASTKGALVRLDPMTNATPTVFSFTRKGEVPGTLAINGERNTLYFSYRGKTYAMATGASALPTTSVLRRSFDGFDVDPKNGTLYGADSRSFTSDGKVVRFQPSGAAIDSFQTAIGPGRFVFY